MKKILYTTFVTVAFLFSSCELERLPYAAVADDQILQDPIKAMDGLLNGAYAQLKDWSDPMHRCGEYAGDNMMIRNTSSDAFFEFISYARTPDNYRLDQFWNSAYKAVAQASNIINMIDEGQTAEVDSKLGECYYIRGLMYFYLCRAYGRPYYDSPETNLGVPIVNGTPDNVLTDLQLPDRSTVKEIYAQVIADLRKAEAMITNEENRGPAYASKEAAQALLSKVYLFMSGTYESPNTVYADSTVYYATEVIKSSKYGLLSRDEFMKYNTLRPEDNKESVFVVKRLASEYDKDAQNGSIGSMYANLGGRGWGEMFASGKYINLLNETGRNDWRPGSSAKIVDARAAFIESQYVTPAKEVFRFIRNDYNESDEHTGYYYVQLPVVEEEGKLVATGPKEEKYILRVVNLEDEEYEIINYKEANYPMNSYTGFIDNEMSLNNGHPQFYIMKCSQEDRDPSHVHSPIISRLGEIYLNRAEAYLKLGNTGAALADVNTIRERSLPGEGYATITSERLDNERQLELAFQAERSYDVYRNGASLTRPFPGFHDAMEEVMPNDYRVIYFIPQKAIDAYPSGSTLTQNPMN